MKDSPRTRPALCFVVGMLLMLAVLANTGGAAAEKQCPPNPNGQSLTCAVECCVSYNGKDVSGYYCCGADNFKWEQRGGQSNPQQGVATVHTTSWHIDWTWLLLGLIVSIVLSVLLSLLCCLVCNGCWLHRRVGWNRRPPMYDTRPY